MEIQSIILPKKNFCQKCADAWITRNKYSLKGKRIKNYNSKNFWRFRQRPPGHFDKSTFRTKRLKSGVEMIIGKLKTK